MKKIVYSRPDGGLSIVHPVINTYPDREEITEDEAMQRAWDKLPPDAINPQIVDEATIPGDRLFRDAWSFDGSKIVHDMTKARDIHRHRLRTERVAVLAALDIAYQRADEASDARAKADIVARKQALRDITKDPAIAAAQTIDDLRAVTLPKQKGQG